MCKGQLNRENFRMSHTNMFEHVWYVHTDLKPTDSVFGRAQTCSDMFRHGCMTHTEISTVKLRFAHSSAWGSTGMGTPSYALFPNDAIMRFSPRPVEPYVG